MNDTALLIECLLDFARRHELVSPLDVYVSRNTLLDLFGLAEPWAGEVPPQTAQTPSAILDGLLDAAAARGLYEAGVPALRVNFEARIMGAVMPRESEVCERFQALWEKEGARAATDYFYGLCIASNYIRTAQIARNIQWPYEGRYGTLEVTINLTKPEKDPKTIALERLQPSASYPKCMLCIENIGYAGRVNFPARQNHRVVPISLCGERWYLQYSPYVYYNEHCIVFSEKHEPMSITPRAFAQIFDFVSQFPHYTCGSNADLPIVGGSILSHMHFQGGRYEFPMQRAKTLAVYRCKKYPALMVESIAWPVTTLRVRGADKAQLLAFAQEVLGLWQGYSDEGAGVLAYSQEDGHTVPHNTITPILHYDADEKQFVFDLVLRNNRTTPEYPDGVFHPHPEIHHIKKENIGLIEVMGLAVLPSRLKQELFDLADVLVAHLPTAEYPESLQKHAAWAEEILAKHPELNADNVHLILQDEVGYVFAQVLADAGVYKLDEAGRAGFVRFLESVK